MARMEISPQDIQRGLPPYCVYCGEPTDDVRAFTLEDSVFKPHVSLPFCEDHVFTSNFIRYAFLIGSLVGIGISTFLFQRGLICPPLIGLMPMSLAFLQISLDRYWHPRCIQLLWKEIELRNIHPQFCEALLQCRAEATDGSD
ncbi:MAG: hypothetical protein ACRC8S_12220 [Fimbriiglobus sp.]